MALKRIIRTASIVLFFAVIIVLGYFYHDQIDVTVLKKQLDQLGVWAPIIFIGSYIVATVALLPGSVFTLAGGAIFGPIYGVLYTMIGASIGLTLAFLIARYVAQEWVQKISGKKLKVIMNGIDTQGWRFVALARLAPIVPFNIVNYALGVTKIPLKQYVITSVICIIPGATAYTYLGYLGTQAAQAKEGLIQKALLALFLLALAAYAKRVLTLIKK